MNLKFTGLSKEYGGRSIFNSLEGQIDGNDRVGLVGTNGIGKTTLANILAGREQEDAGKIIYSPPHINILYLQQYPKFDEVGTVYEYILGFTLEEYGRSGLRSLGEAGAAAGTALNRAGLGEEKWGQSAASLSGGEKTKLLLSRVFIGKFDFLIMDEPTNHLDMEGCEWLEDLIKGLDKPMLIISHDRFFLDNAVSRIWELNPDGLKNYEGNYSNYRNQKEIETKNVIKEYEKQQTRIRELKSMINDRENWYHKAHKAAGQNDFLRAKAKKHASSMKAKRTQLERLENNKIEKPRKELSPAFEVINKNIIGRKFPRFLIQGENISKSFGSKKILNNISFDIGRGDKIAVIGANGSGKTTFLKILCGIYDDYDGNLRVGPSVSMAYFSQELENLDYGATILEDVLTLGANVAEARLLLANLLFKGDEVNKRIDRLSMGERGRVAFAKLILSGANLLVLDELTNYMDIESREKVEEALEQFGGGIIFVSHDRYFIDRLADRIFVIGEGRLHCFDGNYEYYLNKSKQKGMDLDQEKQHRNLAETIMKLEVELAYLGGRLDEAIEAEEKEELNEQYLMVARRINCLRGRMT